MADGVGGGGGQYYAFEKAFAVSGRWGTGSASIWADQLKARVTDAEVLLKYEKSNGWLDEQPAAVTPAYGKGRITYIAAILDDNLMAAAPEWIVPNTLFPPLSVPFPDSQPTT